MYKNNFSKLFMAILMTLLVTGVQFRLSSLVAPVTASTLDESSQAEILKTYGNLPLSFEINQGQTDDQVRFLSRGSGYNLFLTNTEAVLTLRKPAALTPVDAVEIKSPEQAELHMQLINANPTPQIMGLEELLGRVNYFIGNDPKRWHTNISTYAKVEYQNVYPGVDLVYYGNQRQLEYDFIIAPGTDPDTIMLGFQGADKIEIDTQGNLVLHTAAGQIEMHKPFIYQEMNHGVRREIAGSYVLQDTHQVSFQVGEYDASRPLVIDPVLVYSTYLGGISDDQSFAIAVNSAGSAYITGFTNSTDFPTMNAFQPAIIGNIGQGDAFVTKLTPDGTAIAYSTYLGGSKTDIGYDIAVDSSGNAYITGFVSSVDFPIANAIQPTFGGGNDAGDAFVTKLNPTGSALVYSTYLGGNRGDEGHGVALDASGNVYISGASESSDFPIANALQSALGGSYDAFVTAIDSAGGSLIYSTYLGGSGFEISYGIAVNTSGESYIVGETRSADYPLANSIQPTFGGVSDVFLSKINSTGLSLVYSTFLGGSGNDKGLDVALDSSQNAYITGNTESSDFPLANPLQPASGGGWDAFVTKVDSAGSGLLYSTYLGGSGTEFALSFAMGIVVDSTGNAHVTGRTESTDFPTANAVQSANGGLRDAFVTKLNPTGSAFVYSTYLGGSDFERGRDIDVDSLGNVYITGQTASTNFPTAGNPFQPTKGGSSDVFVTKIFDQPPNQPPVVSAGGPYNGAEGAAIPLNGAIISDSDSDPLTISWNVDTPSICSFDNIGGFSPNLTCDDNGSYIATLTVDDGVNPAVTSDASVTVNNVAPSAIFNNDGPVDEGDSFTLSLGNQIDPSDADTSAGFTYAFDCGDGSDLGAFGTNNSIVCPTDDNGTRTVNGQVRDKDGGVTEYMASVMVNNVAPTVGAITAPTDPVEVNTSISVNASFTDPGTLDTHTAEWDWGDGNISAGTVNETDGSDSASGTHSYDTPGVYTVKLTVTDKDGDPGEAIYQFVVVYDPDGGFVTGGGWIDSPSGAYTPDPSLTGTANFGFVSNYKKGADVPTGQTQFQFQVADLNFHSTSYDWLVVADHKAKFKGIGTINGAGNYGFMLSAVDEKLTPSTDVDLFRIKIWDKDNGDAIVYDNQIGADDDADPTTAIQGGNIVIHKAKK